MINKSVVRKQIADFDDQKQKLHEIGELFISTMIGPSNKMLACIAVFVGICL
jgi:hypothetical protein